MFHKHDIYEKLDGRLDTNIIKISKDEYVDTKGLKANIVLLDLHSIWLILYERFNTLNSVDSAHKASRATQRILDNIVNHYAPYIISESKEFNDLSPALLVYLATSADILGLIEFKDYVNSAILGIDDEYLKTVACKCRKLYHLIRNTLTTMINENCVRGIA